MKNFLVKTFSFVGVIGAILGFSVPSVRASVPPTVALVSPQVSESTPLYLQHSRDVQNERSCQHGSHYSHGSHESHASHYSSRY